MRIILTTMAVGLLYTLAAILLALSKATGESFASFLMTFGFILLPAFICVCAFHFVLYIFSRTKTHPTILLQILLLTLIFNVVLFLIAVPDFNRHQNDATYTHFSSFGEYFKTNMLESVLVATAFAILIPVLDRLIRKVIRVNAEQQAVN